MMSEGSVEHRELAVVVTERRVDTKAGTESYEIFCRMV